MEADTEIIKVNRKEMEISVKNWNSPDNDNITKLLLEDIEKEIIVEVEREDEMSGLHWGKSLEFLPLFTRREIEDHVKKCGKLKGKSIAKTIVRGQKFKQERFLNADSVYTAKTANHFVVKCTCRASMKKITRSIIVHLSRRNSSVEKATCSCPAGLSGYCNHVMAALFELADYSLNSFKSVPSESACTSQLRKWGVPGNKEQQKYPVLKTTLQSDIKTNGVRSTLYNPCLQYNASCSTTAIKDLQDDLQKINEKIGFAHVIPEAFKSSTELTRFGQHFIGSPLSHQLLPLERNFLVIATIQAVPLADQTSSPAVNIRLPFKFIEEQQEKVCYSEEEEEMIKSLTVNMQQSFDLQENTKKQSDCPEWFEARKNRITSSNSHKIFTRKRDFEKLAKKLTKPSKKQPKKLKEILNHGTQNEPVAREKYILGMKYRLQQGIKVQETGLCVQPSFPWLGASPDGLVVYLDNGKQPGLLEIKCPYAKRNKNPNEILNDEKFYVGRNDAGELFLKPNHPNGYYTQVQIAMGLAGLRWCHFVVYVYQGLIIVHVDFDEQYFYTVIKKLEEFYQHYLLPCILQND